MRSRFDLRHVSVPTGTLLLIEDRKFRSVHLVEMSPGLSSGEAQGLLDRVRRAADPGKLERVLTAVAKVAGQVVPDGAWIQRRRRSSGVREKRAALRRSYYSRSH